MTVSVPCLDVVLEATPASVGKARRAVREFAARHGASGERLAAIELAVSEAAANAVVHAYRDLLPGELRVQADIEEGELELLVTDDGRGFQDERAPGLGLGLALVRRDALAFEVRDRAPAGVELWARFALQPLPSSK
jgi:anti-sigma regulatory factor (Ser/Thr protein kinase)